MSLYFITGVSGTGKSSLTHELRNRGYAALDTDDDALARWQHKDTGYIHPKSSVKAADRTEQFISEHDWNVPPEFVEQIAKDTADTTAFICGVVNNIDDMRGLFAGVFALTIDDDTLKHRLATRTNNDWGKQPHELEQTLEYQHRAQEMYAKLGYITIDATQPINKVADDILAAL